MKNTNSFVNFKGKLLITKAGVQNVHQKIHYSFNRNVLNLFKPYGLQIGFCKSSTLPKFI